MREKISACITAGNESMKIRRCLESVRWCDEIVVVDSFSTDNTAEICREYTDRVYQHEWLGYIGSKNLIRGMATHPWLLYLDADEEISPDLRDEILREFGTGSGAIVGYRFPRLVHYLGRWIHHGEWYPDYKLRLFRKDAGSSSGEEPHDRVIVNGAVKTLRSPVYHYTYDDMHDQIETINRYTTITAREKFRKGERFRYVDYFVRPQWRFFKSYFLKMGLLDGLPGLFIARISSFGVRMKYAKLWELERAAREKRPPPSGSVKGLEPREK
jgi:glycosyltransferase involved in cell wall biosynthesis